MPGIIGFGASQLYFLRGIPGNALRAFPGSFRSFSGISSGKSQPYWGCGPVGLQGQKAADVRKKDVWDFQALSQTCFELRFSLGNEGKDGKNLNSQTWPGSPRRPSPRHPRPPDRGPLKAGQECIKSIRICLHWPSFNLLSCTSRNLLFDLLLTYLNLWVFSGPPRGQGQCNTTTKNATKLLKSTFNQEFPGQTE